MQKQIKPKPKLVIIEGIAASGKTTLQNLLKDKLRQRGTAKVLSETTTLMRLVDNRSPKIALGYLKKLIGKINKNRVNFVR